MRRDAVAMSRLGPSSPVRFEARVDIMHRAEPHIGSGDRFRTANFGVFARAEPQCSWEITGFCTPYEPGWLLISVLGFDSLAAHH